jgi:prepilin-type N-terminal cleavage/methylation domain-containing protein
MSNFLSMQKRYQGGSRPEQVCGVAFTLIELLTVIAIIAVLASLLMTALVSAKKKSRTAVCTVNLHQISLALNMYLDDEGKHPSVDVLAASKYLPSRKSWLCPEDKTANWGRLVALFSSGIITFGSGNSPPPTGAPSGGVEPAPYSYLLYPLDWDEDSWKRLMRAGSSAGVSACQLHGLGKQENPNVHNYSGLLIRGQRDGAVVRRQFFWPSSQPVIGTPGSGVAASSTGAGTSDFSSLLPIYLDDIGLWGQSSP